MLLPHLMVVVGIGAGSVGGDLMQMHTVSHLTGSYQIQGCKTILTLFVPQN